ncbi:MAG: NUDIX domain-containing protein [Chloroflexota bacterium]|nr:NUDIX domain-containing protein [Chloroflexota bacterium]
MNIRWEKIEEEPVYVGFRSLVRKTFRLPDGRAVDFDLKQEERAVCVLALTAKNHVVLTQEYRPGPEEVLLELPGGGVEASESLEEDVRAILAEVTEALAADLGLGIELQILIPLLPFLVKVELGGSVDLRQLVEALIARIRQHSKT